VKKSLLVLSVVMASTITNAYEYHCKLTESETAVLSEFNFNVATEPNKFVSVDKDLQVGCLQFSSEKPLLSCIVGTLETHQTVVTDLGASIVGLDRVENGRKINLTCLKHN
jgi:hypothetical protein